MSDDVSNGDEPLLYAVRDDGIATITINRPHKSNALTLEAVDKLGDLLAEAEADKSVRCVMLTGAGRAFCAGGDTEAIAARDNSRADDQDEIGRVEQQIEIAKRRHRHVALRLFEMDTPILAVINGAAAGVGLTLAAACDIRLAAAGAKMTTAYARVGRSGDYGTTFFLGRLVGPSRARELMFTADVVNAEQALGIGLVDHVYPAAELLEKSYALAGKIASGPPRAIARMKRMFRVAEEGCLARFLDAEAESHIIQGCSLEGQEFLARFQASRSQK